MATTSVSPVTPTIEQVSPLPTTARPRRDETDYAPVIRDAQGRLRIAPAYSNLPDSKKQYALEACRQGIPESGKRLANCLLCGSVFARTKFNRKLALAHKFPCGELCCSGCNRAEYRLRAWMRERDGERIYATRQVGIELSLAGEEGRFQTLDQLYALAKRMLKWLGLTESVIAEMAPEGWTTIRMVIVSDGLKDCPAIRTYWRRAAGSDSAISFKHPEGVDGRHAKNLLLWAFKGMECVSSWPTEEQVAFRRSVQGIPLIRTTGKHYRRLSDAELAARNEKDIQDMLEGMAQKGWIMEYIPHHQRIVQPCDDIEEGYERVEYRIEFDHMTVYKHTNEAAPDRASP